MSNAFAVETLLDEIAQLTGRNAVDLRLELYGNAGALRITGEDPTPYDPDRMAAVLRLAAERGGFGQAPPAGRARRPGRALHVRLLLRASRGVVRRSPAREPVNAGRRVTIHRITCALDCGIVVNRLGVEAQAQGGIIDGLGHAFFGEVTIDRGRAVEGNFDRYRLIRNREAPAAIDIHDRPLDDEADGVWRDCGAGGGAGGGECGGRDYRRADTPHAVRAVRLHA